MALHALRMAAMTAAAALCIFLPFLPGKFDAVAVPLSVTAQLLGLAGLLLVPVGGLWLLFQAVRRARSVSALPGRLGAYHFAAAALAGASALVVGVSLFVALGVSTALGLLLLAAWTGVVFRWRPELQRLKEAGPGAAHAAPLYLVVIPPAVLLIQLVGAAPIRDFSRSRAIASSSAFIRQIEAYRLQSGRYPVHLSAMWKDYYPDVAGIEKFHYAPHGGSYNLFFEQPRLLLDNFGTREWVVYNPREEPRMYSHTAWFLLLTPEELERSQGWYAAHDAGAPRWKCFLFD